MSDLDTHQYFVSGDVKLVENSFPFARSSPVNDVPLVGDVNFLMMILSPWEFMGNMMLFEAWSVCSCLRLVRPRLRMALSRLGPCWATHLRCG